jgi:hypothetical protein
MNARVLMGPMALSGSTAIKFIHGCNEYLAVTACVRCLASAAGND